MKVNLYNIRLSNISFISTGVFSEPDIFDGIPVSDKKTFYKITYRSGILLQFISVIIACLALSGCISSRSLIDDLAKTPHYAFQDQEKYSSMNSLQQDFFYFSENVRQTHPEPYGAWSKDEFDREQQRILESLSKETDKASLAKHLQSFISRIKDSHTSAQTGWIGGQLQYPVSFFWVNDTLILASVERQEDTLLLGSKVLSFNGYSVEEVLTRFTRFIANENIYLARRELQYYFVFPAFHKEAGIINSDTLELKILTRDGITRSLSLIPQMQPKRIAPYKYNPVTKRVNRMFRYTILKDENACYLQWNTMMDISVIKNLSFFNKLIAYPIAWYIGLGYFDNFLENMFEEMEDKGINTLVIDLRGNGGGSSSYGEQLLYHLDVSPDIRQLSMAVKFSPLYRQFFSGDYAFYDSSYSRKYDGKKMPDSLLVVSDFVKSDSQEQKYFSNITDPKSKYYIKPERKVFKGNVYFLVGEATYSSAIILSSIVKDNNLFTVVGQPTLGRPSHYGETLILKLPNSKIICRISCKKFFRPDKNKDSEDSLYPDVIIWPTFEDMKYGRDSVFDWVLQDAKKKTAAKK
jgi:hypothetical protein